jgi:hypothetical protein
MYHRGDSAAEDIVYSLSVEAVATAGNKNRVRLCLDTRSAATVEFLSVRFVVEVL